MRAIEKRKEIRAAAQRWHAAFAEGAEVIGQMTGGDVHWHPGLEIWGMFGKTHGRGGIERDWNAFGQKPFAFRSNMVVEINQPPRGIDRNIQAVFATDAAGTRWLLHQGRMSVSGSRVTEADFIAATGMAPLAVSFSDGSTGAYHKVAPIDAPAAVLQENIAAFIAQCTKARLAKTAPGTVLAALTAVEAWERGLSPEATGAFDIAAQAARRGRRRHGEVWRALAAELKRRDIPHSNDRVAQYGPDLFTYGERDILFEIKARATSTDVFEGVGQLQIYEKLLRGQYGVGAYRKILVVPSGMRPVLEGLLESLDIGILTFERSGTSIRFEQRALSRALQA